MSSTRVRASDLYEYETSARSLMWRRKWTPAAEHSDETDRESASEYDDDATPDASDDDSDYREEEERREPVYPSKSSRTFVVSGVAQVPVCGAGCS